MPDLASSRRLRTGALWFGLATAVGLMLFLYRFLDFVARGNPVSPLEPLIEEMTGAWAAVLLLPLVVALVRRWPLDRPGGWRRLPAYLVSAIAFGGVHTTLMWGSRATLFPLVGLGEYDYGRMPVRYAMELPNQLILFAAAVIATLLVDRRRAARERERRIGQLETQLARARLDTLRTQLHPHFLFNALNTISSTMYEDVRSADTMLSRLAELLRRAIREPEAQEVPLAHELETIELYLAIMKARFQDRLEVAIDVEPAIRSALVPSLLLQPLVENAIEHGAPPEAADPVRVEIRGQRAGDRLRLSVRDWGPGAGGGVDFLEGGGVGLANTVERLAGLYGRDHRFDLADAPDGGLMVRIEIPYREISPAASESAATLVR